MSMVPSLSFVAVAFTTLCKTPWTIYILESDGMIELVSVGSTIAPTEEGPSPKHLVKHQLFDTFKNLLSLIFDFFSRVTRIGHEFSLILTDLTTVFRFRLGFSISFVNLNFIDQGQVDGLCARLLI